MGLLDEDLLNLVTRKKIRSNIVFLGIYVTLVGVGIIFLVLLGILMNGIYPRVSHAFWTLAIGFIILSPVAMSLRSYGEIKIIR